MIFFNTTAEKTLVVLNDLVRINNDRIACYEQALSDDKNLDLDMKQLFKTIIEETNNNKLQLIGQVRKLSRNPKDTTTLSGVLHRAWTDLKVTLIGNTRNSIINFCLYNEEITQHTYRAALSGKIDAEVRDLIELQQKQLARTYEAIKECREARNYLSSRLAYFN
jgi:uncharacterized protein (TIGR02284 family)